ncbi:MAG TPA: chitobiase/beta-hexosaminidase C-terminal domain-containing protein [Fibrobacteria bacterium]|nr:chitobiase/beta-hexosaminidase C-terminal domain-containing protein [Fibrobacteria bacterium]
MRIVAIAIAAVFLGSAIGQPATLTLRAKLRDFKDYQRQTPPAPPDPAGHPDFENDAYMGCGGKDLGYVEDTLGVDAAGDTSQFRGDHRGPILKRLTHPVTDSKCFTSFDKFKNWYNDNPAVNRSFYLDLVFTRNAQGMYTFDNDHFLPLNPGAGYGKFRPSDPEPFGSLARTDDADIRPGDVWGFTMELHTTFTYERGKDQTFNFRGDDDVWAFVNGRLVIDLGGMHPKLTATVNLDSRQADLGLVDGQSYPLDFFFAERHSSGSHCQITTSLQLVQKPALPDPVADPSSGTAFRDSLPVRLSVPGYPDAVIRYTLDGSEPTETSPAYDPNQPPVFRDNGRLRARAFKADHQPSGAPTFLYTRDPLTLPMPVATPSGPLPAGTTFQDSLMVELRVPGYEDAVIHYTLDGSEPTERSPLYPADSGLVFKTSTSLKAKAFKSRFLPSGASHDRYVLSVPKLSPPIADPPGRTYQVSLSVTLAVPGHSDVVIRYTLDGSEPGETSPVYSGPIRLTTTVSVMARAYKPGRLPSDVMTEEYRLLMPPNVISLRMDSAVHRDKGLEGVPSFPDPRRPIAILSADGPDARCLECPASLEDILLRPGGFPEWVAVSRDPFHYSFHIYDHLGQFVAAQEGQVGKEMLDPLPHDATGYRVVRFRWIPISPSGVAAGTGAYILKARVITASSSDPGMTRSEATLFRKFGYLRRN